MLNWVKQQERYFPLVRLRCNMAMLPVRWHYDNGCTVAGKKDQKLVVDPADILLTSGSQQTIDLLVRIYVNHGDVVLIESPAPPGCLQVLHLQGARVIHVDCDRDGMATGRA